MDNWKHKDQSMLCKTCMYFLNTRCRRHAPDCQKGWPAVYTDDWCGDHKLCKETMQEMEGGPVDTSTDAVATIGFSPMEDIDAPPFEFVRPTA